MLGYKVGDEICPAKPQERIVAFRGYLNPLSNHYSCEITVSERTFKSVEHAYFHRMATEFGKTELPEKIFKAEHAVVAKRLSKGIADDEERLKWEKDNTDVMRNLLQAKFEQCQEFRSLLTEYADVTLAEATPSRFLATGLSPYMTEHTAPNFWSGNNLLGVMLKELSLGPEESIISDLNQPTPNDPFNQIQADVIVHQVDVPASQPDSESSSQPTSQSANQPANQSACQPDAQSNNETVSQAPNLPLSSASNGLSTGVSAGESPDGSTPGPTEESAEGLPVNRSRQKHRSPAPFRGPRSFSTPRRTKAVKDSGIGSNLTALNGNSLPVHLMKRIVVRVRC